MKKNFLFKKKPMKGISIAIETIVYLILAVTVLTVALGFFLTQAGPAQDQYTLEAKRERYCGSYITTDFQCKGSGGSPVTQTGTGNADILTNLGAACGGLQRFGLTYPACAGSGPASLLCIQQCCLQCSQRK